MPVTFAMPTVPSLAAAAAVHVFWLGLIAVAGVLVDDVQHRVAAVAGAVALYVLLATSHYYFTVVAHVRSLGTVLASACGSSGGVQPRAHDVFDLETLRADASAHDPEFAWSNFTDVRRAQYAVHNIRIGSRAQQQRLQTQADRAASLVARPAGGSFASCESADGDAAAAYGDREPVTSGSAPSASPVLRSPAAPSGLQLVRGGRFEGDTPDVCIYIERNKNKNVIVYEARYANKEGHAGPLHPTQPIDAYWLKIDPDSRANNRKRGKMDDRVELMGIEKTVAYGIKTTPIPGAPGEFRVSFVALASRQFTLTTVEAGNGTPGCAVLPRPAIVGSLNGHDCVMSNFYVMARETWLLPKVEYVDLFGVRIADGVAETERITP